MKCKVCGYEYDDSRNSCPMCGTPARNSDGAPMEMKWNTKDFPKPQRELADIDMKWSDPVVSEGYIFVPDRPKRQFSANNEVNRPHVQPEPQQPEPAYAAPTPAEPAPAPTVAQPLYSDPDAQRVPRVEEGRLPEKFYTFQTKNEEFQRLLDKEFERLKDLQSQLPEAKSAPIPVMQDEVDAAPADEFDKMLLEDTAAAETLPAAEIYRDAAPAAPKVRAEEAFDIKTLEDSIRLIREEEELAQRESEERQRKLAAMKAARDAYFKSLDEAEARKPMRGLFWRDREAVKPEPEKAPEQPAAITEKPQETLMPVREPREEAPAPKKTPVFEQPNLEDLTGPLEESPEHTIQFVKEEFLAAQDALLREKAAESAALEAQQEKQPELSPEINPAPAFVMHFAEEPEEPAKEESQPEAAAEAPLEEPEIPEIIVPAEPEEVPTEMPPAEEPAAEPETPAREAAAEPAEEIVEPQPAAESEDSLEDLEEDSEEALAEPEAEAPAEEPAAKGAADLRTLDILAELERILAAESANPGTFKKSNTPEISKAAPISAEPEIPEIVVPAEPETPAEEPIAEPEIIVPAEPEAPVEEPAAEPEIPEIVVPAEPETPAEEPIAEPEIIVPAEPEAPAEEPAAEPTAPVEEPTADSEVPAEEPAADPEESPEDVSTLLPEKQEDPLATQAFLHGLLDDEGEPEEAPEDEEDEEEKGSRHLFLKFLGLFILILILVQLIVFGFEKLLPDAGFTQTLSQIASSIQEACDDALATVIDTVTGWFN